MPGRSAVRAARLPELWRRGRHTGGRARRFAVDPARGVEGPPLARHLSVTDSPSRWRLELFLLHDGHVVAAGNADAPASGPMAAIERSPSGILAALHDWFAPFESGEITVLVRGAEMPVMTWTTRSAGMALYWAAVVLSKTWWLHPHYIYELARAPAVGGFGRAREG